MQTTSYFVIFLGIARKLEVAKTYCQGQGQRHKEENWEGISRDEHCKCTTSLGNRLSTKVLMARHQRLTATKGTSLLSKLEGSGKDVLQLWTDSLFASAFGPSPQQICSLCIGFIDQTCFLQKGAQSKKEGLYGSRFGSLDVVFFWLCDQLKRL